MKTLDDMMETALSLAKDSCSGDRGMARVVLAWDPYLDRWEARADWSDDTQVHVVHTSPSWAIHYLIEQLRKGS